MSVARQRASAALRMLIVVLALLAACVGRGVLAYRSRCDCDRDERASCRPGLPMLFEDVPAKLLASMRSMMSNKRDRKLFMRSADPNVHVTRDSDVTVCFAHEAARKRNEVGVIVFNRADGMSAGELRREILFPDASAHPRGCIEPGDCVSVGTVRAGQSVGFYVGEDAYEKRRRGQSS